MKRAFSILLVLAILCGVCLPGCVGEKAPEETTAQRGEDMPKKLLVSDVTTFPVATDDMTTDELRQLCLDFFELQLGFQWIPNMDVEDWITTNWKKGTYKQLLSDAIYGGIPYQSKGSGNLYRWLEYYDETTGIMDLETAFAENGGYGEGAAIFDEEKDEGGSITYKKYRSFQTLFNQCSLSASWGWGRAINSASFSYTNGITAYNGFIPVGCYSYGFEHEGKTYGLTDIKFWGEKDTPTDNYGNPIGYDTPDVIQDWNTANGADAMYKCYAMMKPADCLVNKGHVMMVKEVNLYVSGDGTVNYGLSSVICLEQIEGWGIKDTTLGEKKFWQQGGIDRAYSFSELMKSNYIPFTFAEFLDENDPQDKQHLDYYNSYAEDLTAIQSKYSSITCTDEAFGNSVEKAQVYSTLDRTEGQITCSEFGAMSVGSNYTVSDVFVTITDSEGKLLLKNIYRAANDLNVREVSMKAGKSTWETTEGGILLDLTDGVQALAEGGHTIEISLQISTGEKLTAFKGTLVP